MIVVSYMTTIDQLTDLLLKHLQGSLSRPEQEQLNEWIARSERNNRLFASINDEEQLRQLVLLYEWEQTENNEAIILSKIRQQTGAAPVAPVRRMHTWRRYTAAVAAIVLLLAGAWYLMIHRQKESPSVAKVETPEDILPGRDGAILTLADGRKVVLDSLGNGVIATEKGTRVVLTNGELAYSSAGTTTPVYNTLTTPRGRQFQLTLPDGTKAWLNAASSLYYPTVFSGDERRVQISGEVYFEVAKDKTKPFIVNILPHSGRGPGGSQLEVLGTQFNVNAYTNEAAIKTTLVEGSLRVLAGSPINYASPVMLQPGQQAQTNNSTYHIQVDKHADVDKVVAWKKGFFNFEDASLEEVMRQLERWYDIEVVYEKGIPDIKFGGKMSNDVSLSGLLKSLQDMEVHFRVEGRKLIVMP
jgi:transmembrane sensor